MNVLIAADYSPPQSGSFGASVLEMGLFLQNRGDEMTLVVPLAANTAAEDSWVNWIRSHGIKVCLWDRKVDTDECAYLQRIVRENQIDIIHLHFNIFVNTVMRNRKLFQQKVLVHDHMCFGKLEGNNLAERARLLIKSLVFRILNIGVVSVSQEKNSVYALAKHWHLPNGLTFRRKYRLAETRETCRKRLGIDENEKVCIILGWDCYVKGVDIVIRALNELNACGEKIVLAYVGIGDPPNKKRIEYIRQKTGVDPFVEWIRYLPSTEDIFAYFRMADAFVSSSRGEGFSFATLEAISQDTPVVLSDIKSTRWAWKYNKAFVYETESVSQCADALRKAVQTEREGSNSTEIAAEYSIEKWCQGMYEIYQRC